MSTRGCVTISKCLAQSAIKYMQGRTEQRMKMNVNMLLSSVKLLMNVDLVIKDEK
jgi:hypothetical protein